MKKKNIVGEVELKGDKLFYHIRNGLNDFHVIDVTPLWNFFKEVQEFSKEPLVLPPKPTDPDYEDAQASE
jgi:hypothetical protein